MATNCKKCFMLKMTPNSKCLCNAKKFDEAKLSKKTRIEKKPKPIKPVSDKRKALNEKRGRFDVFFQKIAKKRCDKDGNAICEYCKTEFNIKYDVINQLVCFAHILSRGDPFYVYLAMYINNIALVCSEKCHNDMDAEICVLGIKKELQKEIENGKTIIVADLTRYVKG